MLSESLRHLVVSKFSVGDALVLITIVRHARVKY